MKSRLAFWIIAAPLWLLSGLIALLSLGFLLEAPATAAKRQQWKGQLSKRGQIVEDFFQRNGRFPSQEEFTKESDAINDGPRFGFELRTTRPNAEEGFKFPEWPAGKQCFAIDCWVGEWFEFYDSNSRTTTLEDSSKVSFWIKDPLQTLILAPLFGILPFILLWLLKKRQVNRN